MLKEIRVGGIDYDVSVKDLSHCDSPELIRLGNHNEADMKIEISDRLPRQKRNQTFIHEMLHAVVCESGAVLKMKRILSIKWV